MKLPKNNHMKSRLGRGIKLVDIQKLKILTWFIIFSRLSGYTLSFIYKIYFRFDSRRIKKKKFLYPSKIVFENL